MDTSTGELLWSRTFDELSRSLATHYGAIVFHDLKTLERLDIRTGDALWSAEMEVTGDLPSIWLEGETILASTPSWVRGIDVRTGHDIFRVDAPEDGRVMVSDAKDGVLRVRVEQKRGLGPEESVFLDLNTGDAVSPDLGLINATPHSIESYLFSVEPGVLPGDAKARSGIVPVFKAEGSL